MSLTKHLRRLRPALLGLGLTAALAACVSRPPMDFAAGCASIVTHSMPANSGGPQALATLNVDGPLAQPSRSKLHLNTPNGRAIALECRSDDFLAALPQ